MKQLPKNSVKRATIWMWGDDFEVARTNSEKYVSKRWKEGIKECAIDVSGLDRDSGIIFSIIAYTSDPKTVGSLAEQLLDVALGLEGDVKVDSVIVLLSEYLLSEEESYRDNLESVKEKYDEWKRILMKKVSVAPEVKDRAGGRRVSIEFTTHLRCEFESNFNGKIIIDAVDLSLQKVKDFIDSLGKGLTDRGLVRCITGYKLLGDVEDLEIEDIYVSDDEIYVELTPSSARMSKSF